MASTLTSASVASGIQPRASLHTDVVVGTYELAAALVDEDVIQMVKVPKGATIVEVILATDDLDTGATPALVLDVGFGGAGEATDNKFINGSTIGQTGGFVRMNAIAGFGYVFTADDTIDVHVETAPATGATSGTITLAVIYTMQTTPT